MFDCVKESGIVDATIPGISYIEIVFPGWLRIHASYVEFTAFFKGPYADW